MQECKHKRQAQGTVSRAGRSEVQAPLSMARNETLRDMLVALQADLCIQGALTVVDEIKATLSSPTRPLPTPHQIAVNLMSGMMAKDGTPIQWRVPRPGQKYPQIIRATRVIMEHNLRKVVLEGTPRGNEVKVDIQGAAADLVARQGGVTGTQSQRNLIPSHQPTRTLTRRPPQSQKDTQVAWKRHQSTGGGLGNQVGACPRSRGQLA